MAEADALVELKSSAEAWSVPSLVVKQAQVYVDENRDGDPVTRILLLLTDPKADTWDVAQVRELRQTLGRRATELRLPPVSLTLVAESERDEAGVFTP
jgi:hypothetical protein